ncbi:hypothetical protein GE061_015951 [Apolygus lucorum]|uniref:Cadherin domain-containing protein n=1 Tax=Apolygus lucorum TaxID=248454 RepID=A0A8S9XIU7_APOLU|nr:hypothetical protein GE061_015951 [Apolygus lucorum]
MESPTAIRVSRVQVHVLDKNDSPPSFEGMPKEFAVSEEARPGETVGTVRAEDPDTIGTISYSLQSGGDGKLTVSSDGIIRLREPLDRETKDSYKLRIRASDGVEESHTIITIKVVDTNDNPPVFADSAYSFDVSEETGRGARVGSVLARDADLSENGRVSYSVISDWANDVFSINPQTGVFTLTARLDYEEVQHYIFVVEAEDGGRPALSSTVSVYINVLDVNDNAPLFDPLSYSNELFENVTIGTSVVSVSATDLDSEENGRIVYSILSGDDEESFLIDPNNGTIRTQKALDRETKSVYNLVVMASDRARQPNQRLSSTVQVSVVVKDVNDMWPEVVSSNEAIVAENAGAGTLVLAVKAIDKDEGRNGYIEYKLGGEGSTAFTLGAVDGLLRVAQPLDRERRANYSLELTARDRGDPVRSTKTSLVITVLDMNDNSPVFDPKHYSASVPENASIGASVLQVSATLSLLTSTSSFFSSRGMFGIEDTMKKVNINVNLLVENTIQCFFPPTNKPVTYDHEDSNIARIATGDILRITINLEINNSASHGKSSLDYIVTMQIHESKIYELRLYEKRSTDSSLTIFIFQ